MKRRVPLTRHTPLRAVTGLTRATPLRRQPAVRPVGGRMADPVGRETRQAVKRRSGGRCEAGIVGCLVRAETMHHRLPRRMGGSTAPGIHSAANLLHVCGDGTRGCHGWLESHRALAMVGGWLLPAGADPASVPVVLRCRLRVLLTADGGYGEALGGAA